MPKALRSDVMEEMFHIHQAANLVVALGALPRFTGQAAPESPGRWCSTGLDFVMKKFIPSVNGERYVEVARSLAPGWQLDRASFDQGLRDLARRAGLDGGGRCLDEPGPAQLLGLVWRLA